MKKTFGYISINKPELKVKEYEIYKANYCGLCRNLGKTYGPFAKLVLNYDLAFVSLLEAALSDETACFEQKRCQVNPFKKCTYCINDAQNQSLAAAATVSLFDLKVEDNIKDNPFFKALIFRFIRLFSKRWAKKAYKSYPDLKTIINTYRNGQRKVENKGECSIDEAAEPTARTVSEIFRMIKCDSKYIFVLERMGYCLGKWIYLCDAADDLKDDLKSGNFNVLKSAVDKENINASAKNRIEPVLNNCWSECAKYFELLEINKFRGIIENILYEGLRTRQNKIFKEEKSK